MKLTRLALQTYTQVTNEVLAPYGKTLSWELKASLMGRPAHDAASRCVPRHPSQNKSPMQLRTDPELVHADPPPVPARRLIAGTGIPLTPQEFMDTMQVKLEIAFMHTTILPGIQKLVSHLHKHNVPIAVSDPHPSPARTCQACASQLTVAFLSQTRRKRGPPRGCHARHPELRC
jgi:pseudouridine-5'-monophosphatase